MIELFQKLVEHIGLDIETRLRSVLQEFGFALRHESRKDGDQKWLPLEDAKKLVPIKSKKKWKQLRDENMIDFAKVGKGYIYEAESLKNYLLEHSTITKNKKNGKRRS